MKIPTLEVENRGRHQLWTRRSLLRRAGLVAPVLMFSGVARVAGAIAMKPGQAALPSGGTEADLPVSDVMRRLSVYMSQARERSLPDEVLDQAKRHVLDTCAAMVSGSQLAPGRAALAFARAYGGRRVATVVGDTLRCGPIEAALANGTMAHA